MTEHAAQITPETIIDQVMTDFPATAGVFIRWRMHCVGCPIARFESIADACRIYQRPIERFLAELRMAAARGESSA